MSAFGCCIWWFLLGILLGWLLNYWLCKCKNKSQIEKAKYTPPPPPAPAPVAKVAETTAAVTPPAPVAAAKPTPTKKATPAKKAATRKATPKPKSAPKKVAIDLAAAKAAGFKLKDVDDLTVIEGIGPKINELFKNNGLKTFDQVAGAKVTEIRAILDKGGARFRIANPGTWAKQAKLAAANKWPQLKKLQDELSGGIEK